MSHTQRITCDLCGKSFGSYEGDIEPLVVKLAGPVVHDGVTVAKVSAAGQVQAVSVDASHVDHDQAIDATDACGECYDALRKFIVNQRKGTKFKVPAKAKKAAKAKSQAAKMVAEITAKAKASRS